MTTTLKPLIIEQIDEKPRTYWTAEVRIRFKRGHPLDVPGIPLQSWIVCDSNWAAWKLRERCIQHGGIKISDEPQEWTKDEIDERAKRDGLKWVYVLGLEGEVVDFWRVA